MDYLCLYITGRILNRVISLVRLLLACVLGGIYSVASLFLPVSSGISLFLDIFMCLCISAAAYHENKRISKTITLSLLYFAVSMTLGGFMTALFNLMNKLDLPFDGIQSDSISVWGFAIMAILAGILSVFGGGLIFRKKEITTCTVEITFDGKARAFEALCDSGNLIKDPISGRPVIILDKDKARGFIDQNEIDNFSAGIPSEKNAYSCMRVTSVNTVSGSTMLVLLRPQKILITYQKAGKAHTLSPDALFSTAPIVTHEAIIPYSLLRG